MKRNKKSKEEACNGINDMISGMIELLSLEIIASFAFIAQVQGYIIIPIVCFVIIWFRFMGIYMNARENWRNNLKKGAR